MNRKIDSKQKLELLPHQVKFLEQFFANDSSPAFILESPPGLGKKFTATELIRRQQEISPKGRILVLAPRGMLLSFEMNFLETADVLAEIVNRFRYREMEDAETETDENSVWGNGKVSILSLDFAKQPDIAESLAAVPWTLLVVAEAHLLSGQRKEVVRRITASSPGLRMLLLANTEVSHVCDLGVEITRIRWERSQIVDSEGRRILRSPRNWENVEFILSRDEVKLDAKVRELSKVATEVGLDLLAESVSQMFGSSPAALEQGLQQLRKRIEQSTLPPDLVDDEDDSDDVTTVQSASLTESVHLENFPSKKTELLLPKIFSCLDELEALRVDTKLEKFCDKVRTLSTAPDLTMCISTDYLSTLYYLETALEEMSLKPYVLRGSMLPAERERALLEFKESRGILLGTRAALEELQIPEVQSLILYDIPYDPERLEQICTRFQHFDRKSDLTVIAFLRQTPEMKALFRRLKERLSVEDENGI